MDSIEQVQERLQHIHSVEPILDALRMIALGSWQKAKKQQGVSQQYSQRLLAMVPALLPRLAPERPLEDAAEERPFQRLVLVVGSERGLCGRFNNAVVEHAEAHLTRCEAQGETVVLLGLGGRVQRLLAAEARPLVWFGALPTTSLPPFALAVALTEQWLGQFETQQIDAADCVYNRYTGMGRYMPTVTPVLPPPLPTLQRPTESWPPPIIETDPAALLGRIVQQWTAVHLYNLLLESAMAEHSVRYQLMESAEQNIERLLEELSTAVQVGRQQAITREMQALAAGAGLLHAEERGR